MRPKTLFILLLLVLGLGAFIWFVERDLPGSDDRAQQAKRVLAIEPDEVVEVLIERGDARVHLTREPKRDAEAREPEAVDAEATPAKREWRMSEPFEARADTATADRLADTLALLEKERTLDDVDPVAVGLEAPRATVTVKTRESESTLLVGSEIPASPNMVLAVGTATFVVPATLWELLDKEAGDWRSRELFPLHRGAVERLELSLEGTERVALSRRDDDTYWIEAPLEDRADKALVDELLDAMFRLEVGEFLDQPEQTPAEMGLEPAARALSVDLVGRDQPYTVEIGAPTPDGSGERFARVGGQVMTIGGELDEAHVRTAADWQETAWTGFEVFEVDSLRAQDEAGELLLERAGSDWQRDGEAIAYGPVSDFLYALTGAAGMRVVDRATATELGGDLATASLEIELKGGDREESLELYDAESGFLAGSRGRQYWLTLSEGAVEDLRVKLQGIRDEPLVSDETSEEIEG